MTANVEDRTLCLCGCGSETMPGKKWKRGHVIRGEGGYDPGAHGGGRLNLPGPDVPDEELDEWIGLPEPGEPAADVPREPRPRPVLVSEEPGDDGEPAHIGPQPKGTRTRPGQPRTTRVTSATRRDVEAKIRFFTLPATRAWAMRDPLCGAVAAEQEPEVASALAEIVCDSPDLLGFFTGPGGAYMKYFRLAMAVFPVGAAVYGHHLAHRGEPAQGDPLQPADYTQGQYAA